MINLFGFAKDMMQGVCAGAIAYVGTLNIRGADLSVLESMPVERLINRVLSSLPIDNFAEGGFIGPVEIILGIGFFFFARRKIARTVGLLGYGGVLAASALGFGVDLSQLLPFAKTLIGSVFGGAG